MPNVIPSTGFILHIPLAFIQQLIQTVSPRAVCVYLVLEEYRTSAQHTIYSRDALKHAIWPSNEEIAEKCGCGAFTVKRAIAELSNAGAISRQLRGGQTSAYTLEREFK